MRKEKCELQGFDISGKSAAVIGVGGLGCNVCVHLVGAGIGKIYICDFDTVGISNLNRQFLYTLDDVGKEKAFAAKERLGAYAPKCEIIALNRKIKAAHELDFISDADVVILCVDNIETRKTVSDFCIRYGKALVNGAINGLLGSCYMYIPHETPCLDCSGMLTESKNTLSVSTTAGVIGALTASLAQRYLTGDKACGGKLYIYDNEEIKGLKIKKQSVCKICKEVNL